MVLTVQHSPQIVLHPSDGNWYLSFAIYLSSRKTANLNTLNPVNRIVEAEDSVLFLTHNSTLLRYFLLSCEKDKDLTCLAKPCEWN